MRVNYKKTDKDSTIVVYEPLNSVEFYRHIIDVFQVLYLKKQYRLSEKELYFAACVLSHISKGVRDVEHNGDYELFQKFGFKDKQTVQVWRKKLVKKFWIKVVDNRYFFTEKLIEDYTDVDNSNFSINFVRDDTN